jgi:hypothetical protein
MSSAIPLLPLWAFRACYRANFAFILTEEHGHRIFELNRKERGGGWSEKIV